LKNTASRPPFVSKYSNPQRKLVACSRKDTSYQHESEVRAIVLREFKKRETKRQLGVRLSVDIERLIAEVMVGPREKTWVVRLVERVTKRYGLLQRVIPSNRLKPRP
jgi:hypothetical protein